CEPLARPELKDTLRALVVKSSDCTEVKGGHSCHGTIPVTESCPVPSDSLTLLPQSAQQPNRIISSRRSGASSSSHSRLTSSALFNILLFLLPTDTFPRTAERATHRQGARDQPSIRPAQIDDPPKGAPWCRLQPLQQQTRLLVTCRQFLVRCI